MALGAGLSDRACQLDLGSLGGNTRLPQHLARLQRPDGWLKARQHQQGSQNTGVVTDKDDSIEHAGFALHRSKSMQNDGGNQVKGISAAAAMAA